MDRQSERYLAAVCLRGRPGRLRAGALLCALALALAAGVSLAGPGALSTRGAAARAAVALPKAPPALPAQVSLPAEGIYRWPELPNGCEATTLAMLLQCYGFDAEKTALAYDYIPRQEFTRTLTAAYGPDPDTPTRETPPGTAFTATPAPWPRGPTPTWRPRARRCGPWT